MERPLFAFKEAAIERFLPKLDISKIKKSCHYKDTFKVA